MIGSVVFSKVQGYEGVGISPSPQKELPLPQPAPGDNIELKTFSGKSSTLMAERFLQKYWDRVTLRVNLGEFSNVTFVGIALRRLPSGAYLPLYYFGYDVGTLDVKAITRNFYIEARRFENVPLKVEGALADEPSMEWTPIGRISTVTTSKEIKTWRGDKVAAYNKFGADFWVAEARMGYYYYVYMSHEAKVPSERDFPKDFRVAVKEVRERATILNPSPEQAYFGVGSFRPEGSGSSSEPTVTWGLNIGIDAKALPSAAAGFSETYTKGLIFKWYTDDIDANRDIEFQFYDLKKKGLLSSSPAWGRIFVAHPVVVPFVKKGTPFHMIELKLRAEAEFVYEEDVPVCGGYGCWFSHSRHTVQAPSIEFTVEMVPVVRK
nr:hypothetical protein [Thermococcus stetteri]